MLTIPTQVKDSSISGLGLFSTHGVRKGTVVWKFHPKLDQSFTENFLDTLPHATAQSIRKYSYINPEEPDLRVLCGDDARFMNFTKARLDGELTVELEPASLALGNKVDGEYQLIAARDIEMDEELTVPLESDADASRKLASSI